MKYLVFSILVLTMWSCNDDNNNHTPKNDFDLYFESIKSDSTALRHFFTQMPKGGDIHHHAAGAPYAEEILEFALADSNYLNPTSGVLYSSKLDVENAGDSEAKEINSLLAASPALRDSIINHWSVRNYKQRGKDGHDQFFSTFFKFFPAFIGHESELLSAICERAARDNVMYLETMIDVPIVKNEVKKLAHQANSSLLGSSNQKMFDKWYNHFIINGMAQLAQENADSLNSFYINTKRHGVTLRFQTYGLRVYNNPILTFGELLLGFKTCKLTDKLLAVNFVAPEDDSAALANYKLHMEMFAYLSEKEGPVNVSLHAGELTIGQGFTAEKDLLFHINDALKIAKATRIGHGVDIAYEANAEDILNYMSNNHLAVEINLESNEVILGTNAFNHPVHLYLKHNVPICISTDDEGVLRTNLINQYLKLVEYVPQITYQKVKQMVVNSIQYSFLSDADKAKLLIQLDKDFTVFEEQQGM